MQNVPGLENYPGIVILYAKHIYCGMRPIGSVPESIKILVLEIIAKIDAGEIVVDWLQLMQ